MPRAGSTLVEQILSSHSLVEGTSELPDMPAIARGRGKYPASAIDLSAEERREAGEEYLKRRAVQRRTDRPFFIDKLPNNWMFVPFIHLVLPNAKIIDARRHPLGCCLSNFRQHFARGQDFTYDLDDLGRYYSDYVRLMAHVDAVLPGRVHRVIYERMVEDTEAEVRALLDYCGLEFEPACLEFYKTERAVRTPSSEQVRQPIYRDATEEWRAYEDHLGPLKDGTGPRARRLSGRACGLLATLAKQFRRFARRFIDKADKPLSQCCHNRSNGGHSMTARKVRALTFGLLASTALAAPAFAQTRSRRRPASRRTRRPRHATSHRRRSPCSTAQDANGPDQTEIIITAHQARGKSSERPDQRPGDRHAPPRPAEHLELRGIHQAAAVGQLPDRGAGLHRRLHARRRNRRRRQPHRLAASVGSYLDEQPVTTIGGTLDVHIYDIARIESLAGPQGTLYGASSEAGTIRIITNKPELGVTDRPRRCARSTPSLTAAWAASSRA